MLSFYRCNYKILFFALLAFVLAGCETPAPTEYVITNAREYPKFAPFRYFTAGYSVEGRQIDYFEIGTGSDVTFILASIHGNESAGTPIARRLAGYLQNNPDIVEGRKVVVLPIANPDGFIHNKRYNANGVDLNRNFEADNRVNNKVNGVYGLSEPESLAIKKIITKYKPNRIISFHEPLNCLDYDGPGESIAWGMGLHCDLEVKKLGSRPGSLGSYAGLTLGIPIITVEFDKKTKFLSEEEIWNKYKKMTLAAIMYPETAYSDVLAK